MSSDKHSDLPEADREAIRARYAAERAKRLNTSGTDQFNFTEGALESFAEDPYATPAEPRAALDEELDVLVIGAGIGGMQLAITLQRRGIHNFRMLDVAGDFGGTWYWNRYPGLRCDVESYVYLPLLEETGFVPSERYVRGSEIFAYLKGLAGKFDLADHALFQTKVTNAQWDETAARWIISTDRGDTFRARFVTTQSGIFNKPQLPGVAGIKDFKGTAFHSARWNYEYTGGSPDTVLDRLGDKVVGVIGTGTTALQVVPELAKAAKGLVVFQRTPTAVGERGNGPTDESWFKSLEPGWQKQRIESFNQLSWGENDECGVNDGWTRYFRAMLDATVRVPAEEATPERIGSAQELADFALNDKIRARVDTIVQDPAKADLLKAYYRTMCKRPGFSDDYLPVFNKDTVHIVDVSGGIDRITENGVKVAGTEYALDCIVFCTGFELGTSWAHQAGYDVVGRGGALLSEKWADGLITYHGLFSHGFPNMFFMGLTQTGITINVPHMLQEQADHIAYIVGHSLENGVRAVEAEVDAENEWQNVMARMADIRRPFQESCTPGYYNAEGRTDDRRSAIGAGWYLPSTEFFQIWKNWRDAGDFEGLRLT